MNAYYLIRDIRVPVGSAEPSLVHIAAQHLSCPVEQIVSVKVAKRSIDARKRDHILFLYQLEVELLSPVGGPLPGDCKHLNTSTFSIEKPQSLRLSVSQSAHVVVVGSGPAGLFAALALSEAGIKTTLIERGKAVETRMRDIGQLRSKGSLDPESNVCFGEGGAGTYTDGKLYTRIKHPFLRWVMQQFVRFGAPADILVDAHPHLGTDKLMRIIQNLRARLIELDVDIQFETKVDDLLVQQEQVVGVRLFDGREIKATHVVLAIGHSARDTLTSLSEAGLRMEAKPFAVGFRAEHPQVLINKSQFGRFAQEAALGAADYRLSFQAQTSSGTRGVYSFCMCPGGFIVPTPTEPGHMVVNGMSNANRSARFANSGIVVQVEPEDIKRHGIPVSPLMGIQFQRELESICFKAVSSPFAAPAMRIGDFLRKKATAKLAPSDFRPAVEAHDLHDLFPQWLVDPISQGIKKFGQQIRGYDSNDGNLFAIESRSSSPIRIPRNDDLQSFSYAGLYPVGEGAGYAGGIVSAAVDGLKAAESIIQALH